MELIDTARLAPSAANLQPLKYMIITNPAGNSAVFDCTAWAGYLVNWNGPAPQERPSAYIIILTDKNISENSAIDIGICAQTITLAAAEKGLGACMIGSIKRDQLRQHLNIPPHLKIDLIIALGYPAEQIRLEDITDSIKYYRTADGIHHVPKRKLDDIIIKSL